MMVVFTSQSDKKAHKTVRWILDAFANRIGTDTWETVITSEGLQMVKTLLRRHATKSMAVSARWIRSRSKSELLWIVGSREKFSEEGYVPVAMTQAEDRLSVPEGAWDILPLVKALAGVAALLHDWGKANDAFQEMLEKQNVRDTYRHEWVSVCLLEALVDLSGDREDDTAWIELLLSGTYELSDVVRRVQNLCREKVQPLPPIASLVSWLILSHHRLPTKAEKEKTKDYAEQEAEDIPSLMELLNASWGYEKSDPQKADEIVFSKGLLKASLPWQKAMTKWLIRLLEVKENILLQYRANTIRPVLLYARLALMLGDYCVSSEKGKIDAAWKSETALIANTYKVREKDKAKNMLGQKLDEHLVKVAKCAVDIAHHLPHIGSRLERVHDLRVLRKKSPSAFQWQDKAVESIHSYRRLLEREERDKSGYFIVNMASTGRGKTFANAKIMQAVSEDAASLRYVLALGLRTLTLQTGDEYRERIRLAPDEMAVLIGSEAVRELHEEKTQQYEPDRDEACMDEQEPLYQGRVEGLSAPQDDFLQRFFQSCLHGSAQKSKKLLYAPVLVATIDHLMPATECTRGGRYMIPFLRLMSSDLVIDEIDDFSVQDLRAIARLVHLAGLMGRNVLISSATIPPDLAQGLYSAYVCGRRDYLSAFGKREETAVVWCDEYGTKVERVGTGIERYQKEHDAFIEKRVKRLRGAVAKRRGYIVSCTACLAGSAEERQSRYFETVRKTALDLHEKHALQDPKTGKSVSIGLLRMANITPCVELGKYLLSAAWEEGYAPRILIYHSQQTLLLRHEEERYLDGLLKRKDPASIFTNEVLRSHIDTIEAKHILFLLVATPVEEVGRDHDFDWAIVEPSSYRSIIQLAGRVCRHRPMENAPVHPNIALMQYNLCAVQGKRPAYTKPGFETYRDPLDTHDMTELIDTEALGSRIDAVPRIEKPEALVPKAKLADLEHKAMEDFANIETRGAKFLHGWNEEAWYLTGLPQVLHPFREGGGDIEMYLFEETFYQKGDNIEQDAERRGIYHIAYEEMKKSDRWWLRRSYAESLEAYIKNDEDHIQEYARRYGTLLLPSYTSEGDMYSYHDQLGLYKKSSD